MDLQTILSKAAPWLAAATAGPAGIAAVAVKTIAEALGATDQTVEAITQAVTGATPEQIAALKAADQAFAVRMRELGFKHETDLAQIAAADRANARDREIRTGDGWTPRILAALVVLAWVSVQWFLLQHVIPGEMRELIARVLGTLDAALTLVLSYYFGSSASSRAKDEVIAGAQR